MYGSNKGDYAKTCLKRYQEIETDIDNKLEEIEELKFRGNKLTSVISDMPRGSKSTPDNMAEKLCDALDIENIKVQNEILKLQEEQFRIKSLINEINNPYKEVLYQRYIKNKDFYEISDKMKKSYEYIRKLHGQALILFYNLVKEFEI